MKALKLLFLMASLRKYGRLITDDKLVGDENGDVGSHQILFRKH